MVRAGLVRQLGAGLWTWLPAGYGSSRKVEQIIREEIDAIGGQEMLMPVLQPAELWRRPAATRSTSCSSSRPQGPELRARDDPRGGRHLPHRPRGPLLPRAAEDPLPRPGQGARRAAAARRGPAHARVHDEGHLLVRPRRARAWTRSYELHADAYARILDRCGLRWYEVESDVGMMGGIGAHEYMAPVRGRRERGRAGARLRRQPRGRIGRAAAGRAAPGAGRAARGRRPRA